MKTNFSDAKGSFTSKGKVKLKWIKVIVDDKEKKLPKSGYSIIERNFNEHTITIRGKKNFAGEVKISL